MANAVNVFPAGMRLTDSETGAPLEGAAVYFYNAGTAIPKTVYSDADLTTAIGTSVITDSLGYPTSSNAKTLVYTDTASYKIRILTEAEPNGVLIAEHDNVKGAVVAGGSGTTNVAFSRPVEEKGGSYSIVSTVGSSDQGKVFRSAVSNSNITFTLPSAVTVGTGWLVTIAHGGSSDANANTYKTTVTCGTAGQTITEGAISYGPNFILSANGEEATFVSNGGNWIVINHSSPHIKKSNGVITVTDRLSAAPSSPTVGDLYILTAAGGVGTAWAGYANHSVVQAIGTDGTLAASWVRFIPPTDCGWIAFVKDENKNYQFRDSAWVDVTTDTPDSTVFATQADMETATSTTKIVNPSVLKNHPAVPKFWVYVQSRLTNGAATILASHNVSGVNRDDTGKYTITFTTAFSSANYCVIGNAFWNTNNNIRVVGVSAQSTSSCSVYISAISQAFDDTNFYVCGFGDQ